MQTELPPYAERAVRAYDAMQRRFAVASGRLYRETSPPDPAGNPYAFLWPFEEAVKATLFMAGLPEIGGRYTLAASDLQHSREMYWDTNGAFTQLRRPAYASYVVSPTGQGGDAYFDDNTWSALDLIQYARMTGDRAALDRARAVFEFIDAGWSTDRRAHPGGTFWVDAAWNRDRGAATNAGVAVLALHLHELTDDTTGRYLAAAQRAYDWLRSALLADDGPTAGLYFDKILGDGRLDTTQWIYNQGVPIAASLMLHRATGRTEYLEQARTTADTALAWYGAHKYAGQPAIFTAIFFRNLLPLSPLLGEPRYRVAMQAFADRMWLAQDVHDPRTDLFQPDRSSPRATLLDQAAMVQIFALLGWRPDRYDLLA
ncbi:MAG: glycosyl hydrolase [Chloroflexi bacterium]|nr:glycosyl hydrolase [Chloroflexota bacterium]